MAADDRQTLELLEFRLKSILPEEYQDTYGQVQPVSMGSAGLKFDADGNVAWNEIWGSFCDLAMAGGPPHKGTLLGPGSPQEIAAEPARYEEVCNEICRGITMASDLPATPSLRPGWVRVDTYSEAMAGWLLRAIAMENVAVRLDRRAIELPAGPRFRLEKEIKNVVTVIAKTAHYWVGHMPRSQRQAIAVLFAQMEKDSPLVVPGASSGEADDPHAGWRGLDCPSVAAAVWMMRMLVAMNVLSRREEAVLFVPVNPVSDPGGERVSQAISLVRQLARERNVF